MDTLSRLKLVVSGAIKEEVELASYTSFRIGGKAKYFYIASNTDEIISLVDICKKIELPFLVLGGGSNILISDDGFDGLVIKIGDNNIEIGGKKMACSGGVLLSLAVQKAMASNLSGLEWAIGIPGTIGGAVHNNAGAYGGDMAGIVDEIEIIKKGKIKKIKNKKCEFSYRNSVFRNENNNDIVLSTTINLILGDKKEIKSKLDEIISRRRKKMDSYPSAGSVFKNITLNKNEMSEFILQHPELPGDYMKTNNIPSAWLVEQCELKGKKIGGAMVSEKHAGRIINTGSAKAENVIILVSIIKQKVRSKFNIQLMEEIEYIGF
jgi:UDP-N-acetylmuramate dehydrogenase